MKKAMALILTASLIITVYLPTTVYASANRTYDITQIIQTINSDTSNTDDLKMMIFITHLWQSDKNAFYQFMDYLMQNSSPKEGKGKTPQWSTPKKEKGTLPSWAKISQ